MRNQSPLELNWTVARVNRYTSETLSLEQSLGVFPTSGSWGPFVLNSVNLRARSGVAAAQAPDPLMTNDVLVHLSCSRLRTLLKAAGGLFAYQMGICRL